MTEKLLTRDDFRNGVFARDKHRCVFCGRRPEETPEGKLDAHHILERRLFTQPGELGGYFLSNGASVCEDDHMKCETTEYSVEEVRERCGIEAPGRANGARIPDYLYSDESYDKWGNLVLANGRRTKGPLFYDESVQKVLERGRVLDLFTDYVKYPRTMHLLWSQSVNDDDRVMPDMSHWEGREIVVTEKRDGENTNIYTNYLHARSVDGRSHPSRNLLKAWAAQWQHELPEGWRVCGENLYARHSIPYVGLPHHFEGFSIWNERNVRLSWDDTLEWFELLGITSVPVLYRGIYDEKIVRGLWTEEQRETVEGYVMTIADEMHYGEFRRFMAKFVRANHVQRTKHNWQREAIVPNDFQVSF